MAATWKSPREIAFTYDDEGALISISVHRQILTEDGYTVNRGMHGYMVEAGDVSQQLESLAEQVILQKVSELNGEVVEPAV